MSADDVSRHRVDEGSMLGISFTIVDRNGNAVNEADLTVGTLTLYDYDTYVPTASPVEGIINDRNHQDILGTGSPLGDHNVTYVADGGVEWLSQPEDNIVITPRRQVERHRALFHYEWNDGEFNKTVEIDVKRQHGAI
jgi:hypothetical protein